MACLAMLLLSSRMSEICCRMESRVKFVELDRLMISMGREEMSSSLRTTMSSASPWPVVSF